MPGAAPNKAVTRSDVSFYSTGGLRLSGHVYEPANSHDATRPGIVLCGGLGSTKDTEVPQFAGPMSELGFTCLTFDFRGFGQSEGEENRIVPAEQVADARAALTFLSTRPDVNDGRLGILGISFGGGIACACSAQYPDIGATVSISGVANGGRWLQQLRRYWEWVELRAAVKRDEIERTVTGKSKPIPSSELLLRDPESEASRLERGSRDYDVSLESVGEIIGFAPEDVMHHNQAPILLVHSRDDLLVPFEHAESIYARSSEPKKLLALQGHNHYELAHGEAYPTTLEAAASWFQHHLL